MRFIWGPCLAIIGGGLLAACGSSSTSNRPTPFVPLPRVSLTPPADHYFIADPDCLNSHKAVPLTRTTIRSWQGASIVGRNQDISGLQTNRSLTGDAIMGTYYDRRYHRECGDSTFSMTSLHCRDYTGRELSYARRAEEHNHLRICKDNYEYPKNSYESTGLTAAASIERTYKRIRSVAPDVQLNKIELEVLPIFKSVWPTVATADGDKMIESYFTNNMAYIASDDLQMITIFPESSTAAEDQGRYWESAFAVAHEFGHHFQAALAKPRAVATQSFRSFAWDPINHRVLIKDTTKTTPEQTRAVLSELWTSMYEASADLFAYYSEYTDSSSLIGLHNIGTNRNIAFASFADNTPKVLSSATIHHLVDAIEGCEPPVVLCSAHNIGAIIAHAFDQTATAAQKVIYGDFDQPNAVQIDERFRMAIAWYKTFANATGINEQHAKDPLLFYRNLSAASESGMQVLIDAHADKWNEKKRRQLEDAVCNNFGKLLPAVAKPYDCD